MKFKIHNYSNNTEVDFNPNDLPMLKEMLNDAEQYPVWNNITFTKSEIERIILHLKRIQNVSSPKTNKNKDERIQIIKNFLESQALEVGKLNTLNLKKHSKRSNNYQQAIYLVETQNLYVDKTVFIEINKYLKELMINKPTSIKNKIETIGMKYDIFNHLYQNADKERIKQVLSVIPITKLSTLKLYQLEDGKKDKFDNIIKTNYKKNLNIIYYQKQDLSLINEFIYRSKNTFKIKTIQKKRKKFAFKGKLYDFSNNSHYNFNNIDYYLDLNGKKYYKLAKLTQDIDEKEVIIINKEEELNKKQINQIEELKQQLKKEFNPNIYNKIKNIINN